MQHRLVRTGFSVAACAIIAAGCQSAGGPPPQPAPAEQAQVASAELCASNMHDVSGHLLQYYLVHQELPPTLEELTSITGAEAARCPATGTAYRYFPDGLRSPDEPRWLVLADPTPSHGGKHSAIVISEPQGRRPLSTTVVLLTPQQMSRFVP